MRTDILERKNDILQWIEEHQSKAFICRELKCKPETLASYLKKMDINYEGNKGLKGKTLKEKGQSVPDCFVPLKSYTTNNVIEQYYFVLFYNTKLYPHTFFVPQPTGLYLYPDW